MKLGEIVVHMDNYNFTKFHQNRMKNKKRFINSAFFCSEFQSVSRIVKIVHSALRSLWCEVKKFVFQKSIDFILETSLIAYFFSIC